MTEGILPPPSTSRRRGFFTTIEGIDGCGKTTVAKDVCEKLRQSKKEVKYTQEPTETWLGEAVKRSYEEDVSPYTELFLFLADRANHTTMIREWLGEGKWVVCDRYADSSYAYQGALLASSMKDDSIEWIKRLSRPFILNPDLTILLDVFPEVGLKRISKRERKTKFEYLSFLEEVRKNYLSLVKREERWVVIDANAPFSEVVEKTYNEIATRSQEFG